MTRPLIFLAASGSTLLLAGAYVFQFLGYLPCQMCLWQRWPHIAAIVLGVLAFTAPARAWAWLGALATATTAGLGLWHTGVERNWWEGPASCTGSGALGGDLLSLDGPRLIMCDQVSWAFLGLSMPSWNALISLALMCLWLAAARAQRTDP